MISSLVQVWHYWCAGGILLVPIALVSFALWMYFLRARARLLTVLDDGYIIRDVLATQELPDTIEGMCRLLHPYPGMIPGVLSNALNDMQHSGQSAAVFENREKACMRSLNRDFTILAALTAVAPLLGLLGTVTGMIDTFNAVSLVGGNPGERVAAGISSALITTQFGLIVALPGVFGLARLQRMHRNVQVIIASCCAYLSDSLFRLNRDNSPTGHAI